MHYTTSCNTQSSAPEDGQNNCPKHVELIGIINKPLLLHLVGCLCYLCKCVFKMPTECVRVCVLNTKSRTQHSSYLSSHFISVSCRSLSNVNILSVVWWVYLLFRSDILFPSFFRVALCPKGSTFRFFRKFPYIKTQQKNSMRLRPIQHNGHRLHTFEACLPYIIPTKYLFLVLNTAAIYYQNRHKEQTLARTEHGGSKDNIL